MADAVMRWFRRRRSRWLGGIVIMNGHEWQVVGHTATTIKFGKRRQLMSPQTRTRIVRTLLQLIAGGALYALTDQIAADVPDRYAPYVILAYTLLVTLAQNVVEDMRGQDIGVTRTPVDTHHSGS